MYNEQEILSQLLENEDSLQFAEETLRNPYSLKTWWLAIDFAKNKVPPAALNVLYERAVRALPGSYKLWFSYLDARVEQLRGALLDEPVVEDVNGCFERALVTMHKMPRIWLDYLRFLIRQRRVTKTRRTFDLALRALPVSQHERIWNLYVEFVCMPMVPAETGVRVFRRYVQQEHYERVEQFVEFLMDRELYDDAFSQLVTLINDENFLALKRRSVRELWDDLCDIIAKNPEAIKTRNVEQVIRGGIARYPGDSGQLWCSLATYYINMGHFEKARDIFEEALQVVTLVSDFMLLFDTYSRFEEGVVQQEMRAMDSSAQQAISDDDNGGDDGDDAIEQMQGEVDNNGQMENIKQQVGHKKIPQQQVGHKQMEHGKQQQQQQTEDYDMDQEHFSHEEELEFRMARLEHLMDRRPLLLSSVKLRQNPHNVHEWHKRIKLLDPEDAERVVHTFSEALQTVDPQRAVGKPHTLWCAFAKFYEFQFEDLDTARTILDKAVHAPFATVEELAQLWLEYAEMEIRNGELHRAKELMQRATAAPLTTRASTSGSSSSNELVQRRVHKSTSLWMLYADLEESLGTFDSTRSVYERILDLKVATPNIVINYACYLEQHKYYEEAFRVYERGVQLFAWPQVYHIWVMYLTKFVKRYGGRKLERIRDLFEQGVNKIPRQFAKNLFLLYAKIEEDYGLARHAMAIYERATKAVKEEEMMDLYKIYIARASDYYGITRTREIYEHAINTLPEKYIKDMCLGYTEMERKLGEIDRARAIYGHAAKHADPRIEQEFWKSWETFEQQHGNVETFKDMLRIKRSVQTSLSTSNVMTSAMMEAEKERERQHRAMQQQLEAKRKAEDALKELEEEAEKAQEEAEEAQEEEEQNEEEISLSISEVPQAIFTNNIRQEMLEINKE